MENTATLRRQPRFVLPGSEKKPLNESTRISPPSGLSTPSVMALRSAAPIGPQKPAKGKVTVSIIVKRKNPLNLAKLQKPAKTMSHAEYARRHGANPESVALVTRFAKEYGLRLKRPAPGRRDVQVTGTVTAMQSAFGVDLRSTVIGERSYRTREGSISLPRALYGHVEAALGLDNRPQGEPHFRCAPPVEEITADLTLAAASPAGGFLPPELAALYQFPDGAKALGQTIALLELGGGFRQSDLTAFFKLAERPEPKVVVIPVGNGTNAPTGDPTGPDGEVALDIEVAGSVAPGATIAVYFAPNTDKGFADGIAAAVHDTRHKPSVISISWGSAEAHWTGQSMTAIDDLFQSAAALGITVTAAAGDHGSADSVDDGKNHVDFPASSPHVLSCGGTTLIAKGSAIASEKVWNEGTGGATGGGVSNFFPLPAWQDNAKVPKVSVTKRGRGVPDVAGDADQKTGYTVVADGQQLKIGGTSAVAPLWAGLIAIGNAQRRSGSGFINAQLYSSSSQKLFRDIVAGSNGAFKARKGWDACTGLGSPIGTAVLAALASKTGKQNTKKAKRE